MKKYKQNSFEAKIDSLLPKGDNFEVVFHELWRESEGGWSVNSSWYAQHKGDRESTIKLLRDRWEIFKLNYLSYSKVKDIEDTSNGFNGYCYLEVDCVAFANVKLIK